MLLILKKNLIFTGKEAIKKWMNIYDPFQNCKEK